MQAIHVDNTDDRKETNSGSSARQGIRIGHHFRAWLITALMGATMGAARYFSDISFSTFILFLVSRQDSADAQKITTGHYVS